MIICLNGTSSSGKTSVAKCLQELMGGYPLNFSIDHILYALPESALQKMIKGQENKELKYQTLEEGFYSCVRSLAGLGHDLIIDNSITSSVSARMLVEYLDHHDVVMVGIHCGIDELKRRESVRRDRTVGLAESQIAKVHLYCQYDLILDSTKNSVEGLAKTCLSFIKSDHARTGLSKTKALMMSHSNPTNNSVTGRN